MDRLKGHLLRRGRVSECGRPYLLTIVTRYRLPLFNDMRYARTAIGQLRKAEQESAFRSLAWVLMPDHLHWLIELGEVPLERVVRRFKSRSSRAILEVGGPSGGIWQPGFHDRALRRDEDIRAVARYIVANPRRAGLTQHLGDYSHWDAVWL